MIYCVSVYTFVCMYFCISSLIYNVLLGCLTGVINDYDTSAITEINVKTEFIYNL